MREFQADGRTVSAYLAVPKSGSGPGVLVLHAWWGLNDFFKQTCDRLARAGFIALAPDLYPGKTTASIDEADQLSSSMEDDEVSQDLAASIDYLLKQPGIRGQAVGVIGFSLGGFLALGLKDHIAAIVPFYGTTAPERVLAQADVLGHFAEHDDFEPPEQVREFEEAIRSSGRQVTFFTYPGTHHWFFEENRPEYDADAARVAWKRTIEFLRQQLD